MFEACIKAHQDYDLESYERFLEMTSRQTYYAACEGARTVAYSKKRSVRICH